MKQYKEKIMKGVFLTAACTSILAVILICAFLFMNGLPAIGEIGPVKFLVGERWMPKNGFFGIFPMIMGSLYITAGAIIVGVPVGIFTAVFMAKFCSGKLYNILKPAVDLFFVLFHLYFPTISLFALYSFISRRPRKSLHL